MTTYVRCYPEVRDYKTPIWSYGCRVAGMYGLPYHQEEQHMQTVQCQLVTHDFDKGRYSQ